MARVAASSGLLALLVLIVPHNSPNSLSVALAYNMVNIPNRETRHSQYASLRGMKPDNQQHDEIPPQDPPLWATWKNIEEMRRPSHHRRCRRLFQFHKSRIISKHNLGSATIRAHRQIGYCQWERFRMENTVAIALRQTRIYPTFSDRTKSGSTVSSGRIPSSSTSLVQSTSPGTCGLVRLEFLR
jgi:hypothetical protein